MEPSDIKIDIKLKNKTKLLANADLQILTGGFGWISVKDFQIWKSPNNNERLKAYVNITPPSTKVGVEYIKRVFLEDIKQWEKLEKLIYEEYLKKQSESAPINPKDVDAFFQ